MPRKSGEEGTSPDPASGTSFVVSTPLVIVSERGRHDEAARRVVRAQAARASAPQSRITRARNREEREAREGAPQSPSGNAEASSQTAPPPDTSAPATDQSPLLAWITSSLPAITEAALNLSLDTVSATVEQSVQQLTSPSAAQSLFSVVSPALHLDVGRQLPMAVPRGFSDLGRDIEIDKGFMLLISRTACFDFGSPGVETRLHQLLVDLIVSGVRVGIQALTLQCHPIQGHFRVACTCLTIFQGQRADGRLFANDPKYNVGLSAAWSEAMLLDQQTLAEKQTERASFWAIFIISVTTGANAAISFFQRVLHSLLQNLNVKAWEHARSILLDFIYPVSLLEEPCKNFFQSLQTLRIGMG